MTAHTPLEEAIEFREYTPWGKWALFTLLALLLHILFLWIRMDVPHTSPPRPVELTPIDTAKLEAIKKAWKQKQLILQTDPNAAKEKEAPRDAKFESDRNHAVEKEQRARVTNVIPQSGIKQQGAEKQAQEKTQPEQQERPKLKLGDLGVPFRLQQKPVLHEESYPIAREAGDQTLIDKSLPEGDRNLLNTQESIYYSFYSRLYESIGPLWQSNIRKVGRSRRVPMGEYTTSVDVVLDTEGNLVQVRQIQGSGISEFDQAVEDSWKRIDRFPNPPKGLVREDGYVHTGWTFTVNASDQIGLEYLPPERNY